MNQQSQQALAALSLVPGWGLAATAIGTVAGAFSGDDGPRVRILEDQYGYQQLGWGVPTLPEHRTGRVTLSGTWPSQSGLLGPTVLSWDQETSSRQTLPSVAYGPQHVQTASAPVMPGHPQWGAVLARELGREAALRGGIHRLAGSTVLIPVGTKWFGIEVDSARQDDLNCPGSTGCSVDYARTFIEPIVAAQALTLEPTFREIDLRGWDGRGNGAWQRFQESGYWATGWTFDQWAGTATAQQQRAEWLGQQSANMLEHARLRDEWFDWKEAQAAAAQQAELAEVTNAAIEQAWYATGGELALDPEDPTSVTALVEALSVVLAGAPQPAVQPTNAAGANTVEAQAPGGGAGVTTPAASSPALLAASAALAVLILAKAT